MLFFVFILAIMALLSPYSCYVSMSPSPINVSYTSTVTALPLNNSSFYYSYQFRNFSNVNLTNISTNNSFWLNSSSFGGTRLYSHVYTNESMETDRYFANEGTLFDGFNSNSSWVLQTSNAYSTYDIVHVSEGNQSITINTGVGSASNVGIDFTTNVNISSYKNVYFDLYVPNVSKYNIGTSLALYFASSGTFATYYICNIAYDNLKNGWNRIVLDKGAICTTSNGEKWNNNITKIRFRLYASGAGVNASASFDNLRFNYAGSGAGKAIVLIVFDDGWENVLSNAYPILSGNGQVATEFIITSYLNKSGYMTLNNLTSLYNAGWDISSHGGNHVNLTALTAENLDFELSQSKANLTAWGFGRSARFFAYPFHKYNDSVVASVKNYYKLARDGFDANYQAGFYLNQSDIPFAIKSKVVLNTTTTQTLRDMINRSINQSSVLVLLFHQIVTGVADADTRYNTTDFQNISDYLKLQQDAGLLEVRNFSYFYDYYLYNQSSVLTECGANYSLVHSTTQQSFGNDLFQTTVMDFFNSYKDILLAILMVGIAFGVTLTIGGTAIVASILYFCLYVLGFSSIFLYGAVVLLVAGLVLHYAKI